MNYPNLEKLIEIIGVLRSENGEYPTKLITDEELITKLDQINELDSQGYINFENKK